MLPLTHFPITVSLHWVPGSMHLVQFRVWERTFVVALVHVHFVTPQAQSPLYLQGTVRVGMADIQLSISEQRVFDALESAARRDDVVSESWPHGGSTPAPALVS